MYNICPTRMLGDNDLCMKSNNSISKKINEYRSEVETMIQGFQRQILEQEHKIEELKNSKERELDTLFKDLLSVIDAYEKAEARLDEQYSDNEAVIKAKKRFSTSKKKLMEILRKNGVSEIQFPDGYAKMDDCQIVETEPDATKENDTIISIEKAGFRRNGRLLRLADVIVVKN